MTATIGVREAGRAERRLPVAVVTTDGHSWSWPELFETFGPAIRSFAGAKGVRSPDDIVQDVFVVAVEKLQRFQGDPAGLRSLLFTIAYRRIADEHRRFYRRPETLVATHAPTPDTGPQVEDVVGSRDSVNQAIRAFSVLNPRERHVLEMRILQEATPAQVAASIGASSGNVRVIQSRALSKIRKYLESEWNDGASRTMATVGMLLDTIRYLREKLPGGGVLGQWIDEVRDSSAKVAQATGAISAGAGAGSAAASVAPTSVVASGAAKLTMIITLTASTIGAGVIATGSEPFAPIGVTLSEEVPVARSQPDQEIGGPEKVTAGSEAPVEVAPDILRIGGPGETVDTGTATEPDRVVPFAPDVVEPNVDVVEDLGRSASADVVDPLVGAVVDDVVDPLVRSVVDDVVDPLLGAVVDDVVDPLVDDVVDPLVRTVVDDVVDPLVRTVVDDVVDPVDDVLDPLLDDVVDPVDDLLDDLELPPILGGLLGG